MIEPRTKFQGFVQCSVLSYSCYSALRFFLWLGEPWEGLGIAPMGLMILFGFFAFMSLFTDWSDNQRP